MFLPDMDVALQFLQARQRLAPSRPSGDLFAPLPRVALPEPWFQGPLEIGLLMLFVPPVAVTLVWASPRFEAPGRLALTIFGAVWTVVLLGAVIAMALV